MLIKAQILSISLVVALGISTLFGFSSVYSSLVSARDYFYKEYQFADLFLTVKRAPNNIKTDLLNIKGIQKVQLNTVQDALVEIKGFKGPIVGRFIGIPDGAQPELNKIFLTQGRLPLRTAPHEVVVNDLFFQAHQLRLGDSIDVTLNGRKKVVRVVGVGISPEYIIAVHGATPMPDNHRFGVFWLNNSGLSAAFNMRASFNSAAFKVAKNQVHGELVHRIDLLMNKYGSMGALERSKQMSNNYLSEEIKQIKTQSTSVPIIFFIVAAFILNIVLGRMVATQRREIATYKALGFNNLEISRYFLSLALIIVLFGTFFGVALGVWIGQSMTELYGQFYRFPIFTYSYTFGNLLVAFVVSFVTAFLGIFFSLRKIFKLTPAEAMRPPAPPNFNSNRIEGWGLFQVLSMRFKMAFRGVTAYPIRSVLTGLGVSLSMVILISGLFWSDCLEYLLDVQYGLMQRETGTVTLSAPVERKALYEVARINGISMVEGEFYASAKITHQSVTKTIALIGVSNSNKLRQIVDKSLNKIEMTKDSVFISKGVSKSLNVKAGDSVKVEFIDGRQEIVTLKIHKVLDDFMGGGIYLPIEKLSKMRKHSVLYNKINFLSPKRYDFNIYSQLKDRPRVLDVSFKDTTLDLFNESSVKYMLVFSFILALFAGAIAFGVVYNNIRVSLSERDWELATLQILGFTVRETFIVLVVDVLFLVVVFLPVGWALGYLQSYALVEQMTPEMFQIPFIVNKETYLFSAVVIGVSFLLSSYFMYGRIKELDIIETLKSRG